MIPVFWELVPPSGATITMVGGQSLGNMQLAHAIRLTFPAENQAQIAEWLRKTADFLSSLPQGQSIQVPPPQPLQAQQSQYYQPQQLPTPAPVGHNNIPDAPVGSPFVQVPPPPPAAPVQHPGPNTPGFPPVPSRQILAQTQRATPATSVAAPLSPLVDEPFQQMAPAGAAPAAPPAAQVPAVEAHDTERPPPPRRHKWDRPYEIGHAQCLQCRVVASGTEEHLCNG